MKKPPAMAGTQITIMQLKILTKSLFYKAFSNQVFTKLFTVICTIFPFLNAELNTPAALQLK